MRDLLLIRVAATGAARLVVLDDTASATATASRN
jgi:hypothetical protein